MDVVLKGRPMTSLSSYPARRVRRILDVGYAVLFTAYLVGLLVWLLLGLLPPLAVTAPAVTELLTWLQGTAGLPAALARGALAAAPDASGWPSVAVEYLFSIVNLVLGLVLVRVRPQHAVTRLLALAFVGTAATFNAPSHVVFHLLMGASLITALHFTFHVVSGVAYVWAVLLFPDSALPVRVGRSGATTVVLAVSSTAVISFVCYRSSFVSHPPFFVAFFGILVPVVGIASQAARMRRLEVGTVPWQQSRLLTIALVPALVAAVAWLGAHGLALVASTPGGTAVRVGALVQAIFPAVFAVVPATLAVGILRYRLWDVDRLVSRALAFSVVAGLIGVAYGTALLATRRLVGGTWSAVAAVTVVAVAVDPVRRHGQALANRAVFGQRLSPPEALRSLAAQLDDGGGDPTGDLVAVVVDATRCSGAELWVVEGDTLALVAASGRDVDVTDRVPWDESTAPPGALAGRHCEPVLHDGRLVAFLALTVPDEVTLPRRERALIRELADHAGLLVTNSQLTRDLARQLLEVRATVGRLASSRRQVVAAQDAERRTLERNLHDGAQQELVAALLQLGSLAGARPSPTEAEAEAASEAVAAVRRLVRQTRGTIDQLAHGSPPEVLVRRGLAGALSRLGDELSAAGMDVRVTCRLPDDLSLPVQAALYYCGAEALQNAAKHSRAQHVVVTGDHDGFDVVLTVSDDGVGLTTSEVTDGSGLAHLGEQLGALGGTARLAETAHGVTMECRIPYIPRCGERVST